MCFAGLISVSSCGQQSADVVLSVPTGVSSLGTLNNIRISWTAVTGDSFIGYNVYRSSNGGAYSLLNSSVLTGTSYDDVITSPSGDGIIYSYKVTAVGNTESDYSAVVSDIHGTRIPLNNPNGFTTLSLSSPYVAQGYINVTNRDFIVTE